MKLPAAIVDELCKPYALTSAHIDALRRDGFVRLQQVFSAQLLAYFRDPLAQVVAQESVELPPLAERDTYGQAFAQIMNIWTRHNEIRPFILNRRCAEIAARLLGSQGVRLWHDQALYKEAGGGATPWHCDQFYWPLASDAVITAWIPLQQTLIADGALQFAAGSHRQDYGRHCAIDAEGDRAIAQALGADGVPTVAQDFALGDVSFHLGWTFHCAHANSGATDRAAMTVIYIDQKMRLARPRNTFQQNDQATWAPGCSVGDLIASDINPVLYTVK